MTFLLTLQGWLSCLVSVKACKVIPKVFCGFYSQNVCKFLCLDLCFVQSFSLSKWLDSDHKFAHTFRALLMRTYFQFYYRRFFNVNKSAFVSQSEMKVPLVRLASIVVQVVDMSLITLKDYKNLKKGSVGGKFVILIFQISFFPIYRIPPRINKFRVLKTTDATCLDQRIYKQFQMLNTITHNLAPHMA